MARPQFVTLQPSVLESRLEFCSRSLQRPFLPVLSNSHRHRRSQHHLVVQASRQDDKSLSQLEREVPPEQRPVNELQELKESSLYSWATLELSDYAKRLVILWGGVFVFLSGPIAYQTFDPTQQPIEYFLSASTGSLLVVAVASLRIFLGWKYVADRLMTAVLAYEESGWYDGQQFVKPPEILTRDRLLGTYEVRPVMARLKRTLQGTGIALLVTAVALSGAIKSGTDSDGVYGRGSSRGPSQISPDGIIFSQKVNELSELKSDDEAAAAEAEAQKGIPGYCRDRYYKAFAGGERICDKFEREARQAMKTGPVEPLSEQE